MGLKKVLIVLVLGLALLSGNRFVPRRIGDHLQIALPLAGLACAAASGQGVAYLIRFAGFEMVLHGSKEVLGTAAINIRPDGNLRGFPSGHTAAATFGAVGLTQTCLASSLPAMLLVGAAAGFTGVSRVWAERHTQMQVLAGAVLGWTAQIVSLAWLSALIRRMRGGLSAHWLRLSGFSGTAKTNRARSRRNAPG